jgi:hypothetical protein
VLRREFFLGVLSMIITDIIKNTPRILVLIRSYFVDFSRFLLDVKSGDAKARYDLVLACLTWSLAVILCANILSKAFVGQNLLEFSVETPAKKVVVNGIEVTSGTSIAPSRIEVLYDGTNWFLDIGYRWVQFFRMPTFSGNDTDCVLVQSNHGPSADETTTRSEFASAAALFPDSCRAHGRPYLIAADGPTMTIIEGSGGYVSPSFRGPIGVWSNPENAVLDRTYFGNGAYRIGFDYLNVRRFALVIPVLIVWIYGMTYAIAHATADRLFFSVPFRQSFDVQIALVMVPYTVGIILLLLFLICDRIVGTVPTIAVAIPATLAIFHFVRVTQSLGGGSPIAGWKKAGATMLSLVGAWTVGGLFFLPALAAVVVFHETVAKLF